MLPGRVCVRGAILVVPDGFCVVRAVVLKT